MADLAEDSTMLYFIALLLFSLLAFIGALQYALTLNIAATLKREYPDIWQKIKSTTWSELAAASKWVGKRGDRVINDSRLTKLASASYYIGYLFLLNWILCFGVVWLFIRHTH